LGSLYPIHRRRADLSDQQRVAGSERGADRAAVMATLIMTAKLNDVDPQAWLADVLARINDHAIHRLDELLPWNWAAEMERRKLAA
jgi:hypothetical protein